MSDHKRISPVAEWKGVCINQFDGDKIAVWEGKTYWTDGFFYLMLRSMREGHWQFERHETEEQAKLSIESMTPEYRKVYADMDYMFRKVLLQEPLITPVYEWNEKLKTFKVSDTPQDGLQRSTK